MLVEAGAKPNAPTTAQMGTPLHLAARHGHAKMASYRKALTASAADSVSLQAAREQVELLLANGAETTTLDGEGVPPLLRAVMAGQVAATAALLTHADVNAKVRPKRPFSPLSPRCAALLPSLPSPFFPPTSPPPPTAAKASDGATSLLIATAGKKEELISLLLAAGADIEMASTDGYTPLLLCAHFGTARCFRRFFALPAPVDPPLSRAGLPAALSSLFLSHGALLNRTDNEGFTALHTAARHGHADIMDARASAPFYDPAS